MIRGTTSEEMRDKEIEREERHAAELERALERLAQDAVSCPFCGCIDGRILHDIVTENYCMTCDECGCCGPVAETAEHCVYLWNNRIP